MTTQDFDIILVALAVIILAAIFILSLYWFSKKQILTPTQKISLAQIPKLKEDLEIASMVRATYDSDMDALLLPEIHDYLTPELDANAVLGRKNLSITQLERQSVLIQEQHDQATIPVKKIAFAASLLGIKATLAEKKAIASNDARRKLK